MNLDQFTFTEPTYEGVMLLVDFVLKGSLILLAALALNGLMRRSQAAARHLVLAMALLTLALLPFAGKVLPQWHIPVLSSPLTQTEAAPPSVAWKSDAPLSFEVNDSPISDVEPMILPELATPEIEMDSGVLSLGEMLDTYFGFFRGMHWTVGLLIVWGGGIGLLMAWQITGIASVAWITHRAEVVKDERWLDAVDEIADRLFVSRLVRLMKSPGIASPVTWGFLRPVILIPVDADDWSDERRRSVLIHEMAHIKRWDAPVLFLAQLGCAIHWFNPLSWRTLRFMRLEQEKACDDLVLSHGTKPSDYASHLLDFARMLKMPWTSPLNAISMARPSQLEGRVVEILNPDRSSRTFDLRSGLITIAIGLIILGPLSALTPWYDSKSKAPPVNDSADAFFAGALAPPPGPAPSSWSTPVLAEMARSFNVVLADTSEEQRRARAKAVNALREALNDEDEGVRRHAILMLTQMKDRGSVDMIAQLLESDPSPQVRETALVALMEIAGPDAILEHLEAVASSSSNLRRFAIAGLAESDRPHALNALLGLLEDSDPEIRQYVVMQLADRKDPAVTRALNGLLDDADSKVRATALMALAHQADHGVVESLHYALNDESPMVRRQALLSLADLKDDANVDVVIEVLKDDPDVEIRRLAVQILGDIGDIRAVDALTEAVKDDDPEVRRHAMQALSSINYGGNTGSEAEFDATLFELKRDIELAAKDMGMALGELSMNVTSDVLSEVGAALSDINWEKLVQSGQLSELEQEKLDRELAMMTEDLERSIESRFVEAKVDELSARSAELARQLAQLKAEQTRELGDRLSREVQQKTFELQQQLQEIDVYREQNVARLNQYRQNQMKRDYRETIDVLAKLARENEGSPECSRVLALLKAYDSPRARQALKSVQCEKE